MNYVAVKCSLLDCKNNEKGYCSKNDLFINDAETGEPVCQDFEEKE